jgi:predicted HTH domain antitoxin
MGSKLVKEERISIYIELYNTGSMSLIYNSKISANSEDRV